VEPIQIELEPKMYWQRQAILIEWTSNAITEFQKRTKAKEAEFHTQVGLNHLQDIKLQQLYEVLGRITKKSWDEEVRTQEEKVFGKAIKKETLYLEYGE
jgi:hypothetical protein